MIDRPPRATARKVTQVLQRVAVFAAVLVVWQIVAWSGVVPRNLLPAPGEVLDTFVDLLLRRGLLGHVGASVRRVIVGVVVGVALAVPVGFALGWYPAVRRFFDPLINFMRALPPIALAPLVVVYLGIGESARVVVLVYASFFAATVVTYEGISGLEPIYVRAARSLGANGREIFFRVVLPQSLPHILTAFRIALGVSWATLVAAELVAAQQGLGAMIQNASNFFQIPVIFVGIIMIGVAALLMDQVLRASIARLVAWRETV
ncbi:MAG: ABC transporter permease [Armatimonadota bacterium]|nr:ABC transporter permease [Armatimonadota bacterium]